MGNTESSGTETRRRSSSGQTSPRKSLVRNPRFNVVVAGLDGAGKTTVTYQLHLGKAITTIPTVTFNQVSVKGRGIHLQDKEYFKFDVRDLGAQSMLYHLWPSYYEETEGLVFVVDAAASAFTTKVAKKCLHEMLNHPQLRGIPLLVLANKSDLPWAKGVEDLVEDLDLERVAQGRQWTVRSICAITGDGLTRKYDTNSNVPPFRWLYERALLHDASSSNTSSWIGRLSPRSRRRAASVLSTVTDERRTIKRPYSADDVSSTKRQLSFRDEAALKEVRAVSSEAKRTASIQRRKVLQAIPAGGP